MIAHQARCSDSSCGCTSVCPRCLPLRIICCMWAIRTIHRWHRSVYPPRCRLTHVRGLVPAADQLQCHRQRQRCLEAGPSVKRHIQKFTLKANPPTASRRSHSTSKHPSGSTSLVGHLTRLQIRSRSPHYRNPAASGALRSITRRSGRRTLWSTSW